GRRRGGAWRVAPGGRSRPGTRARRGGGQLVPAGRGPDEEGGAHHHVLRAAWGEVSARRGRARGRPQPRPAGTAPCPHRGHDPRQRRPGPGRERPRRLLPAPPLAVRPEEADEPETDFPARLGAGHAPGGEPGGRRAHAALIELLVVIAI